MRIAIHGTGKMGTAVERIALDRRHEITAKLSSANPATKESLAKCEVVIDFSHESALTPLVEAACDAGVDLVIGTTGWNDRLDDVRERCRTAGIGVVWAPNFSPGANLLFAVARRAAELASIFGGFESGIEERHHSAKRDAPSGTAIRLADEVESGHLPRPSIVSSRVGKEYGLHTLFLDSPDDLIELTHRARSRDGFARGAIIAAERLRGHEGFYTFEQLLDL